MDTGQPEGSTPDAGDSAPADLALRQAALLTRLEALEEREQERERLLSVQAAQLAALQSQVAALQTLETRVEALAQDQGFEQEQQTDESQEMRAAQERLTDLEHETDSQAQQLITTQEQLTALQATVDAGAAIESAADQAPPASPAHGIVRGQSVEELDRQRDTEHELHQDARHGPLTDAPHELIPPLAADQPQPAPAQGFWARLFGRNG